MVENTAFSNLMTKFVVVMDMEMRDCLESA